MEKRRKPLKSKERRLHGGRGKVARVFHGCFENMVFHRNVFLFHRELWETSYRLELMLVLISLTISAKAGSFFIFFSICWME